MRSGTEALKRIGDKGEHVVCARFRQRLGDGRGAQHDGAIVVTTAPISGEIDAPIDGRRAVTRWKVTGRHRSLKLGGGHLTSLELFPQTGRTHQLRRYCAEQLGCPMVGDAAYGGEDAGSGLLLSAVGLEFSHPAAPAGAPRRVAVAAEEPTKFAALRRREHARWLSFHGEERGAAP